MGDVSPIAPKLLPMLSTFPDAEVVAAAQAIGRTLQSAGLDWNSLAAAPASFPAPERDGFARCSGDDPGSIAPSDWHAMAKWARDNKCGRLSDRAGLRSRPRRAAALAAGLSARRQAGRMAAGDLSQSRAVGALT